MARDDTTSAIIDGILKLSLTSAVLAAGMVAPNAFQVLGKLLDKQLRHLDERARERELRRIITHMKNRKLLSGDYKHGLQITTQGKNRLKESSAGSLAIHQPPHWDGMWRIVFYDIPEEHRRARRALIARLRELGFLQLQQSVLIHPLPCRDVIEKLCVYYDIDKYVTYIETSHIDNEQRLIRHFKKTIPILNSQ